MKWTFESTPSLEGKNIVVTGGNSGLGLEALKMFAAKGANVIMASRSKERAEKAPTVENKEQVIAIKDQILNKIKEAESEGGIEIDNIIMNLRETSPEIINQEVKKLIEEGIIFEPRPGKLRYLG